MVRDDNVTLRNKNNLSKYATSSSTLHKAKLPYQPAQENPLMSPVQLDI